jgi:hypothetical protein
VSCAADLPAGYLPWSLFGRFGVYLCCFYTETVLFDFSGGLALRADFAVNVCRHWFLARSKKSSFPNWKPLVSLPEFLAGTCCNECFTREVTEMKKSMIVALAALATLLLLPLPGLARESRQGGFHPQGAHSQGTYSHRSSSPGSYQRGVQPRGSYQRGVQPRGSYQRGVQPRGSYRQGGYTRYGGQRGTYSRGGYRGAYPYSKYRYGRYPYGGHRYGGYSYGGYRYGGYPYGGYRYWGYPYYGSNVYFNGSIWLDPAWGPWWGWPAWQYYYPYYSTPPVVVQQPPTEYIERGQEPEVQNYWYHCSDPEGYYPAIQRCPGGWTKEIPSSLPPDQ